MVHNMYDRGHHTVYVLFLCYRLVHDVWYGPPIRLFMFCFSLQSCALCMVWATHQTIYILFPLQTGALCVVRATHQTVYVLFLFYRVVHYLWYGPPIRLFMFYSCFTEWCSMYDMGHPADCLCFIPVTHWCTISGMGHPSDCLCFIPVYRLVHYVWYGPPIRLFMFYSCFTEWCSMYDMGHPTDCLCFIPVLQSGALCVIWATHQTVYVLFLFYRVVHYV